VSAVNYNGFAWRGEAFCEAGSATAWLGEAFFAKPGFAVDPKGNCNEPRTMGWRSQSKKIFRENKHLSCLPLL
jgi:hypothetical protein